jgi:hypothetical protein
VAARHDRLAGRERRVYRGARKVVGGNCLIVSPVLFKKCTGRSDCSPLAPKGAFSSMSRGRVLIQ